jgi:ABC-type phosphate transport system substrate-binding protein
MKYQNCLGVIILLFGLFIFSCPAEAGKAFQVIVHFENPNESLDLKKMKKIFLGKIKAWPKSKNKIALVDLPDDSPAKKEFSEKILGKSVEYMSAHWQKQIFGARGKAPKKVSSAPEAIQAIAQDPDAVGYVAGSVKLSEPNIKLLTGKAKKSSGDLSW